MTPHALATLMALSLAPHGAAAQAAGATWDVQFQEPLDLAAAVAVLDLDPDAVTAREVARLRARGVLPVCYVSVGTSEDWRADAGAFPPEVLGRAYEGWEGETFLDARRLDVLVPIMAARFRRCAEMGFAAVDPDNADLHINATGFPLTQDDVVAYVEALAGEARALGLRIGQKNVPDLTGRLEPLLDFAVTEDCLTDGWCEDVAAYAASGKAILAIEYLVPDAGRPAACARARAMGLSMVFKSLALDASGARCG